jgi:hypothetical protein
MFLRYKDQLLRKKKSVYSQNHAKPINTLRRHAAELLIVKAGGM